MESFQVVVQSNKSKHDSNNNRSYYFRNSLNPPLKDMRDYEVGIASLSYYDYYKKPFYDEADPLAPLGTTPLFDKDSNDSIISVYTSQYIAVKFNTEKTDFIDGGAIATHLQTKLMEANVPKENFKIKVTTAGDGSEQKIFIYNSVEAKKPLFHVQFSPYLQHLLELKEQVMLPGKIQGNISLKKWNERDLTKDLSLVLFDKNEMDYVRMDSVSDQAIESLDLAITNALLSKPEFSAISFELDDTDNSFTATMPSGVAVQFSDTVNVFLGLHKSFHFTDQTRIYVPLRAIHAGKYKTEFDVHRYRTSAKVLCCSSIINGQHYGEHYLPILAMFDRKQNTKGEIVKAFEPIIYHDVADDAINHIDINLYNDFLNHLPFSHNPTVVTLHFRKKK